MTEPQLPTGPVPTGWQVIRLRDATTKIGSGATPRGGNGVYVAQGVTFIRSQNVLDHRFSAKGLAFIDADAADDLRGVTVQAGDVLLNITGDSILRCCVVPTNILPARVNQHVAIIRSNGRIAPLLLQKYLTLPAVKAYMLGHSAGGTRKAITKAHIESFPVPVPPADDQRSLCDLLGALDGKIESNRSVLKTLDALIEAEYSSLSIDTSSVLAASQLEVQMGSPFKGSLFTEVGAGRPLIRIRDLTTMRPQLWTTEVRPDEKVVEPGDVLVGMDAEFRSSLWLGPRGVLNQRVCRFVPRDGVARAFALHAIRPDLRFFESAKSGTTLIHLNKSDIQRFQVPDLSSAQHQLLRDRTDPLVDRIVAAAQETRVIERFRDTLLPEVMSGRLRPSQLDDGVEVVV